jgi:hypothetical protein
MNEPSSHSEERAGEYPNGGFNETGLPWPPVCLIYFRLAARTFAQRALAAREIFRRAAALIFRRLGPVFLPGVLDTFDTMASSCDWRRSIFDFKAAMRFNLATERLSISFMRAEDSFGEAKAKAISLFEGRCKYAEPGQTIRSFESFPTRQTFLD